MRVLVTRPAAQAAEWTRALRAEGVDAVALPLIAIGPPADSGAVRAAWDALALQRLVVFASPNAAERFFALRPAPARWPAGVRAASMGPGTSAALLRLGVPATQVVEPDRAAAQFDSEALWAQLEGNDWRGARVLWVRGDGGRPWLADTLRARGAEVTPLAAYRRAAPAFDAAERARLDAALALPARHLWFFSSSEAIDNLAATTAGDVADWAAAAALATHPRIAERARRHGFGRVAESRPTLEAVRACIQSSTP